jgi:mannose-6-phosphate isomerase-like protein (cupin superfamily)
MTNVKKGEGWAVGSLDGMGDGPGFRKIRQELDVAEFGINAIVMPPGIESGFHYHDVQEELYFVHSGELEIEFGDGTVHRLGAGGMARVDAPVHRKVRNAGTVDAVYVVVGAKDGYVGRDGQAPPGDQRVKPIG